MAIGLKSSSLCRWYEMPFKENRGFDGEYRLGEMSWVPGCGACHNKRLVVALTRG